MSRLVLTTGIGSMPYRDPLIALDMIFKYTPYVPFWPQLPQRDIREGMVIQFSEGFNFLKVSKEGLIYERENSEKKLEDFYSRIISEDIDYFKITADFALGLHSFYNRLKNTDLKDVFFIKLQITGPFTFAAAIKDDEGFFVLQDKIIMEAITQGLLRKALWQIERFKEFKKRIILFFDEPYLSCFGSAYTPINRDTIVKVLEQMCFGLKSLVLEKLGLNKKDILLGVHCCGNTDWSIFTEICDLDIISFDAFSFGERLLLYTDNLKNFLKRGGIFCWGIVPTLEFNEKIDAFLILERFHNLAESFLKKKIEKELLLDNLILSPSCGLGNVEVVNIEKILGLLLEVSFQLKRQF